MDEAMDKKLYLAKMLKDTKLFKKGQKVWYSMETGAAAAHVVGRYRGKGRWIRTWIYFDWGNGRALNGSITNAKELGEVEVSKDFYDLFDKVYWR